MKTCYSIQTSIQLADMFTSNADLWHKYFLTSNLAAQFTKFYLCFFNERLKDCRRKKWSSVHMNIEEFDTSSQNRYKWFVNKFPILYKKNTIPLYKDQDLFSLDMFLQCLIRHFCVINLWKLTKEPHAVRKERMRGWSRLSYIYWHILTHWSWGISCLVSYFRLFCQSRVLHRIFLILVCHRKSLISIRSQQLTI